MLFTQNIEKWFHDAKKAEKGDTERLELFKTIQSKMDDLKDTLTYFKSDLYLVPRTKEGEFRRKYDAYMEKLSKYELASKKLELVLNNDTAGLRQLKN